MINRENLEKLIHEVKSDEELIELIQSCLESFGEYHHGIYDMETNLMLYNSKDMEMEEWQSFYSEMDDDRNINHNQVISSVRILNRMAAKESLPPIYEGTVSEESPYREEIADAVFAYIETIIRNRR